MARRTGEMRFIRKRCRLVTPAITTSRVVKGARAHVCYAGRRLPPCTTAVLVW